MRETRTHGSEGRESETNQTSLPLSKKLLANVGWRGVSGSAFRLTAGEDSSKSRFRRCRSDGWCCFLRRSNWSRSGWGNAGGSTGRLAATSTADVVAARFPAADALFADFLRRFLWRLDHSAGRTVAHAKGCSKTGKQAAGFATVATTSSASPGWSAGAARTTLAARTFAIGTTGTLGSALAIGSTVDSADSVARTGVPRKTSRRNADRFGFDVVARRRDIDFFDDRFTGGQAISVRAAAGRLAAVVGHRDRRHCYADQSQRRKSSHRDFSTKVLVGKIDRFVIPGKAGIQIVCWYWCPLVRA